MNFTWDSRKARANLSKHRIPFEEAITVFFDPLAKAVHDPDHSAEKRNPRL
ncbi:BrnT family toxin [Bdellovibrio bacteriovorus]|uniref:BrnT family toxin n=1 Tax=Bdellovibrio bacteriovorus TaxID=959 RepID=UPI0009BD6E32